jgi:hypothetical protein
VKSDAALEVEGCVGVFCGGETWTRVSGGAPAAASSAKKKSAKAD